MPDDFEPKIIRPFGRRRESPTSEEIRMTDERMGNMLAEGMRASLIAAGLWDERKFNLVPPPDIPTGDKVNESVWEII